MLIADMPTLIPHGIFASFCGLIASPFFLIISGISYEFFLASRLLKGISEKELSFESFFRAVILLIIVAIPLFIGSILYPEKFTPGFHWSIFQIIAVGYLIGIFIKRNIKLEFLLVIGIFALYYILNAFFSSTFSFFLSGELPPLPYLAYFFVGRMGVEVYSMKKTFNKKNFYLFLLSVLFLAVIIIFLKISPLSLFYRSRDNIIMFSLISIWVILLTIAFHTCVDLKHRKNFLLKPFERIGKIAFSSYYILYVLWLAVFPVLNSYFLIHFSYVALAGMYILLVILIVLLLSIFENKWSEYNYKFGIEWLLREGVKFVMKMKFITRLTSPG
jgi:hypothetical protein